MTFATPPVVRIPGRFWSFLEGSGLVQQPEREDEVGQALGKKLIAGTVVRHGFGIQVLVSLTDVEMDRLREYAEFCMSANEDECGRKSFAAAEYAAARSFLRRYPS